MPFRNSVVGGTTLVRPAIKSPDYAAGVSGWSINRDGSAEFNNLTIRGTFNGTNFIINEDGIFLYDGTPANGNLVVSITNTDGTDAFGNDYLNGVVTYVSGTFSGIASGDLRVGDVADGYPTSGIIGALGTHSLLITAPTPTGFDDSATVTLVSGDTTTTPQSSASYPHIDIGAGTAGVMAWTNGAVIKSSVNGGVSTAETWNTPTFNANWASTGTLNGNSTFHGLQYRKDAEDNVWLYGAAVASGAGASIFTLPAGYRPPTNNRAMIPCWIFDSSAGTVDCHMCQVTDAGIVNLATTLTSVTIAAGDQVFLNGKFPLGNIA